MNKSAGPLVVGCIFSLIIAGTFWEQRNTDKFIEAMRDATTSTDDTTLARAKETLQSFHEIRRFPLGIDRDRALATAIKIGYTEVFKYNTRISDVWKVVCFSENADFVLRCQKEGTINETLTELIIYARSCNNQALIVELTSKSKL